MKPPWEVLGLEPGCTESDLRQAYARLLKEHRPDRDPEGFRLIRDAYEWMRENTAFRGVIAAQRAEQPIEPEPKREPVLQSSTTESESPNQIADPANISTNESDAPELPRPNNTPIYEVEEPASSPSPEEVRPRRTLIERVERKLRLVRRDNDVELERRILKKILKMWRSKTTRDDAWDHLILQQLNTHPAEMLPLMDFSDGVTDVSRDGSSVASALIVQYSRRAAWPSVLNMLEALEKSLQQNPSPAVISVILVGARHIALLDWKRSQALANAVYPHLSSFSRAAELGDMDRMIQAGKEMATLSPKDRSILARCMANNEADSKDESVRMAIRNVSMITQAPTARTVLGEQFPPFAARLKVKPIKAVRAPATSSSESGISRYWWVWLVVFSLSRLGNLGTSSRDYDRPTPQYRMDDEQRKKLEEIIRKHKERQSSGAPSNPSQDIQDVKEILNRGNPAKTEKKPPAAEEPKSAPPKDQL